MCARNSRSQHFSLTCEDMTIYFYHVSHKAEANKLVWSWTTKEDSSFLINFYPQSHSSSVALVRQPESRKVQSITLTHRCCLSFLPSACVIINSYATNYNITPLRHVRTCSSHVCHHPLNKHRELRKEMDDRGEREQSP